VAKSTQVKKSKKQPPTQTLPARINPYQSIQSVKVSQTFSSFQESYGGAEDFLDKEGFERLLLKFGYSTTWVYISVRRIADAVCQIPLYLVEPGKSGQRPTRVAGYDGGLQDLVNKPNPWQRWLEFCEALVISLELTGNAYIELVMPPGSTRPTEMYILNPSRITIIPDKKNYIKGYIYEANGARIPLRPDQVIHLKYNHPMNDFYGFAPLTAARLAVETDKAAGEWNQNFLLRGAWPVGALETEADLDEDDKKRLQRQIKQVMSLGKDSSGRLLLLTGGMKYNKLAVTSKDVDWADARRMSRDEILAIFGVPFAIAGLFSTEQTTARSAGVEQQIKQFYRTTIFPKVELILSSLNLHLAPLFRAKAAFVADYRSVPALQEEVDQEKTRAEALRTLVGSGLSLNKAMNRLYPDIEPEPWGDGAWMNQAMMYVDGPQIPPEILDVQRGSNGDQKDPPSPKPPVKLLPGPALQRLSAFHRIEERIRQR
jgi:HK97 family phage portal protein